MWLFKLFKFPIHLLDSYGRTASDLRPGTPPHWDAPGGTQGIPMTNYYDNRPWMLKDKVLEIIDKYRKMEKNDETN